MKRRVGQMLRTRAYRVLTRLPRARMERALALSDRTFGGVVKVAGGIGVGLRFDLAVSHIQTYGLVRGSLEPGVQEAFRRSITPGAVVWDVGANLGFFSLLALRLGAARVDAFEPEPANVAALRRSLALNDAVEEVVVHPVAVGASSGRASLLQVSDRSWSHLADRGMHPLTVGSVEVDVVALDALSLPAPSLVKIDVEGSEAAVLQGMAGVLRASAPVLIVELHGTNAEVCALLASFGYSAENLDGPEPVEDAGPVHILARPRAGTAA